MDSELFHFLIFKKEIQLFGNWVFFHPQVKGWGALAKLVLTFRALLSHWFSG